jgi:HD-GYP domain-containing protein (c-di-GMP phosphodiesterase class II)
VRRDRVTVSPGDLDKDDRICHIRQTQNRPTLAASQIGRSGEFLVKRESMLVKKKLHIPLSDLITCLSDVIDLIHPGLVNHHQRVAYVAYSIAGHLGLSPNQCNELLLAGKLHDIGILSNGERVKAMQFELKDDQRHAEIGWLLLREFAPLAGMADIIRFHHTHWDAGGGGSCKGVSVPIGSHILHLADRVTVLLRRSHNTLSQTNRICREIEAQSGGMFMPEVVGSFLELAKREYFWLDLAAPALGPYLRRRVNLDTIELDIKGLVSLAHVFARIIDFRSSFTATHSSGVAASAASLAMLAGCSETECEMMKVAGYLHDLGKLAVPTEILEKTSALTTMQRDVVRCHPFYTYRTLERIDDLSTINSWSSFHHECLDGSGYPFHLGRADLPLGSRIMAVADVFTAITEDRPYRDGMATDRAFAVLDEMVAGNALDAGVVSLLVKNFRKISDIRMTAQSATGDAYHKLQHHLDALA